MAQSNSSNPPAGSTGKDGNSGSGVASHGVPAHRAWGMGSAASKTISFYNPYFGTINYPAFGEPRLIRDNLYYIPSGECNLPMWKAPSGFFYPWVPRPVGFRYEHPLPVLMFEKGNEAPSPLIPPMSVEFSDMEKYLEEAKKDGRISEGDCSNIVRRVRDLKSKERSLRMAAGGSLDSADETTLRRELDDLSKELILRLNR